MQQDKVGLPGGPAGVLDIDLPVVVEHGLGEMNFIALQGIVHGLGDFKKEGVSLDHFPLGFNVQLIVGEARPG